MRANPCAGANADCAFCSAFAVDSFCGVAQLGLLAVIVCARTFRSFFASR